MEPQAKKVPQRKCVGCREMKDKPQLVRIVKVDKTCVIDPTGKMQGRGAYICKRITCIQNAQKAKGLERSFRGSVGKDVYSTLTTDASFMEA